MHAVTLVDILAVSIITKTRKLEIKCLVSVVYVGQKPPTYGTMHFRRVHV